MPRLRIQRTVWPRPTLILTDTPRPNCPNCDGHLGLQNDDTDTEDFPCGESGCLCYCPDSHVCGCDCPRCPYCQQHPEYCDCDDN